MLLRSVLFFRDFILQQTGRVCRCLEQRHSKSTSFPFPPTTLQPRKEEKKEKKMTDETREREECKENGGLGEKNNNNLG